MSILSKGNKKREWDFGDLWDNAVENKREGKKRKREEKGKERATGRRKVEELDKDIILR